MIRTILFSLLLSLLNFTSFAQEDLLQKVAPDHIPGKWKGKLIQGEGGLAREYTFELNLELDTQNKIKGHSYIYVDKSHAKISLKGELKGNQIHLQEIKIVDYKITPSYLWCIKKMDLKFLFKRSFFRLEGKWTGSTSQGECTPGVIQLKKATIKA
ncbi:MAG: hypothetical protein MK212_01000 [Saprospiraceae bacterium]|nr:hypothetical protein [Saprospiraceae bacterium]